MSSPPCKGGERAWPRRGAPALMSLPIAPPPLILSSGLQPAKSKDPRPRWPYSGAFDRLRLSGGGDGAVLVTSCSFSNDPVAAKPAAPYYQQKKAFADVVEGIMRFLNSKILGAIFFATSLPHPVYAQTLDFDCDVPENRFSSVTATINGAPMMSGNVRAVEMRSGKNLPVAGGRFVGVDGLASLGFQLIAPSHKASKLDIVLTLNRGNNPERYMAGQIDAAMQIPFSLSLTAAGSVSLQIGGQEFTAEFMPMPQSNAMIFCSTGQFKFTGLSLTSKDQ